MGVLGPSNSRVSLDGEDRSAAPEDSLAILSGLLVEGQPTGQGNDTSLQALLLQLLSSVDGDGDLRAGSNDGEILVFLLNENVATLLRLLDGGALELGKILTGEGEDGRSMLRLDGNNIGSGGLVAIGGAPEGEVGGGTEGDLGLDRLVSRSVLTQTNGVVGSYWKGRVIGDKQMK
jgi:hypothetical protein